jgi:methylenetetrahydrofolate reductase (NADPH)
MALTVWLLRATGYVYQKEYLEFFCSPENKDKLLAEMVNFPTLSYHVVNAKGESVANTKGTAAVTWGVFPGKVLLLLPSRLPLCPV